jgi:hypothetical protein
MTEGSSIFDNTKAILLILGVIVALALVTFLFYQALNNTKNSVEEVVFKNKQENNKDIIHTINHHENLLDKLKKETQSNATKVKINSERITNMERDN